MSNLDNRSYVYKKPKLYNSIGLIAIRQLLPVSDPEVSTNGETINGPGHLTLLDCTGVPTTSSGGVLMYANGCTTILLSLLRCFGLRLGRSSLGISN